MASQTVAVMHTSSKAKVHIAPFDKDVVDPSARHIYVADAVYKLLILRSRTVDSRFFSSYDMSVGPSPYPVEAMVSFLGDQGGC